MRKKDESAIDLYKGGTHSEAWFSTAQRRVSAAGATAVLVDDHLTRQLIVDELLPRLQDADEATSYSPIKQFTHGYELSLSVTLKKTNNSVDVYLWVKLPQDTEEVEGVLLPCWRLQSSLSRLAPAWGGTPEAYKVVRQSGPTGMGREAAGGYTPDINAHTFPAGKSVSSISDIEEHLLVGGRLRLRLEVSACSKL